MPELSLAWHGWELGLPSGKTSILSWTVFAKQSGDLQVAVKDPDMGKTCMFWGKACSEDRSFKNAKGKYLHTECMDTYLEPLEKETFLDQLLRPRYKKWTSFVYCHECQRPMRKDRCWSAIEREGNAFWMNRYCLACQGQVMGVVPLWFL
ncbi:hypothetical protein N8703_02890, partial [Verrucomicrobia bacterium]|nr:hypothetical protein [Verrucomicrobiota bacterium]